VSPPTGFADHSAEDAKERAVATTTRSVWAFVRSARRRGGVVPLALALIGAIALPGGFGLGGGVAAQAHGAPGISQVVPGERPSIAVFATGEASAPAIGGRLQLILRAVDPFAVATEGQVGPPGQPPPLTEEQVRPVAAAIGAAGAGPRNVDVVVSAGFGGPFGPGAAQVLVDLERGTLSLIPELVAVGTEAAGESGLYVESVGAGFEAADCDALRAEARAAAAEDGRRRAEGVAEAFGVTLGELLLVAETPTYDGGTGFGCAAPVVGVSETAVYFPAFDPAAEPEVEVYAQLNVAYAIA
jgi:Protein of unknown function (DUF541)